MNENQIARLSDKDLLSCVITAVMSSKQGDRDEACKKLQFHIHALETDLARVTAERDRYRVALNQIYIGAAEPYDGLTYTEIAGIADTAMRDTGSAGG